MAAVPIQVDGVLWDHANKSARKVSLIGQAHIIGLTVGGGPIFPPDAPPEQPPSGGVPIHPIWGPPGFNPPGEGMPPGIWGGPIIPLPPEAPNVPPPGSPPVVIGGTQPVNPMVPPSAVVIEYPGIGKVVVPKPVTSGDVPQPPQDVPPHPQPV